MKANELRIGNYFMFGSLRHDCKPCDIDNLYKIEIMGEETPVYEPIPLTEEWLLKFGFQWSNGVSWSMTEDNMGLVVYDDDSDDWMAVDWNRNYLTTISYVHQLQNLYFVLTGEELSLQNNQDSPIQPTE